MIKGVLFQESLYKEPFWMLVACSLVNQTTWKSAEPVFHKIRARWPTVEELGAADQNQLYSLVAKLGLGKIRAQRLPTMATSYQFNPPKTAEEVMQLPGCGKYAADSWAIFVENRRDVDPTDKELIAWLAREKLGAGRGDIT